MTVTPPDVNLDADPVLLRPSRSRTVGALIVFVSLFVLLGGACFGTALWQLLHGASQWWIMMCVGIIAMFVMAIFSGACVLQLAPGSTFLRLHTSGFTVCTGFMAAEQQFPA